MKMVGLLRQAAPCLLASVEQPSIQIEFMSTRSRRRARSPGLHPGFNQRAGLLLRARHGCAAEDGLPGPADEGVLADMVDQVIRFAPAIACGVFDLRADLADGLTLPGHVAWGKVPVGMAGHAPG